MMDASTSYETILMRSDDSRSNGGQSLTKNFRNNLEYEVGKSYRSVKGKGIRIATFGIESEEIGIKTGQNQL